MNANNNPVCPVQAALSAAPGDGYMTVQDLARATGMKDTEVRALLKSLYGTGALGSIHVHSPMESRYRLASVKTAEETSAVDSAQPETTDIPHGVNPAPLCDSEEACFDDGRCIVACGNAAMSAYVKRREQAAAQKDAEISRLTTQLQGMESDRDMHQRMLHAAASSLGEINEALGLDSEDDADCILTAIAEKNTRLYRADESLAAWNEMAGWHCRTTLAGLEDYIQSLLSERTDANSRFAATAAPVGYVIHRPAKPLMRFSRDDTAQARALVFARGGVKAQVFALVPVGMARPGAEWVDA